MTLKSFQIQIINLVYSVKLDNLIKMQKCQSKFISCTFNNKSDHAAASHDKTVTKWEKNLSEIFR